jgi:hypothetical protein
VFEEKSEESTGHRRVGLGQHWGEDAEDPVACVQVRAHSQVFEMFVEAWQMFFHKQPNAVNVFAEAWESLLKNVS